MEGADMENATACSVDDCGRRHWARGLCASHYSGWYRRTHGRKRPQFEITCAFCARPALVSGPEIRCCSVACGVRLNAGWSPSLEIERWVEPAKPRREPPPPPRRSEWWQLLVYGACCYCGEHFMSVAASYDTRSRYCSPRCAKARDKKRRRAAKRDAYVADVRPSSIYERDGYRCQLCGRKVRTDKATPHPDAPVLDHILPLAAGGTHEPANVQLAHFLCNSRKGDRPANDQLRLVG